MHKSSEHLESLCAEVLSKYGSMWFWGSCCSNESCLLIRTCSSLGPVRRSRVSCMLKNPVEKPGRRSISSCAVRDSTAPARARPRSAGPAQSQTLVTVTTWPLVWVNRGSVCVFVQEPRHLQYVADLGDLNVYTVVNSRKLYGAPTDFTFCIKVSFFFLFFSPPPKAG